MALSHKEAVKKKEISVKVIKEKMEKAKIAIITDYRGDAGGLTVKAISELRGKIRETKGEYRIFKNTMSTIAFKEVGAEKMVPYLKGPNAIVFAYQDPAATSKALMEFIKAQKDNVLPTIRAAYMDGKVLSEDEIKVLATLPPKDVLLGNLLRAMNGPVQGFVNVLNAVPRALVTVLSEIKKQKEEAGA